jgi:hypothetical protein
LGCFPISFAAFVVLVVALYGKNTIFLVWKFFKAVCISSNIYYVCNLYWQYMQNDLKCLIACKAWFQIRLSRGLETHLAAT